MWICSMPPDMDLGKSLGKGKGNRIPKMLDVRTQGAVALRVLA